MVLLQELSELLQAEDPEERQIITGVSWESYEALLNDLGDSLEYRVTYLGLAEKVVFKPDQESINNACK